MSIHYKHSHLVRVNDAIDPHIGWAIDWSTDHRRRLFATFFISSSSSPSSIKECIYNVHPRNYFGARLAMTCRDTVKAPWDDMKSDNDLAAI